MGIIDELEVIDGYSDGDRFIMRALAGHATRGAYKTEELASMARLIHDDEPFNFTIDKERTIFVPVELNRRLIKELFMIAEELESNRRG